MTTKVIAYIDGFNLYFGLRAGYGHRYLWLDVEALASTLLKPGQELVGVRYFTARVRNDPPAEHRQGTYLSALSTRPLTTVIEGRFQKKRTKCRGCATTWKTYEEKETDVSIAVALVEDAVSDAYDTALLVSGDSDLCPGVRALKRLRPEKRVIAVFPPNRHSDDLRQAVDGSFVLGAANIRRSLLPDQMTVLGTVLTRPAKWR